jgi:hypothetical protein
MSPTLRDQSGSGPWLLVFWALGMIPTIFWVWIVDWPASCTSGRLQWAECIGEAVLLSVVGVMYGLFWPIYWFVRLIEAVT